MASTFHSVLLALPELAAIVFEFQFGVYADVRPVFRACNDLVEFDAVHNVYDCDASFHSTFAPDRLAPMASGPDAIGLTQWKPTDCALHMRQRDDRLPLHLAIAHGCEHLAQRMLRCRPDLASDDAILLALHKNRLEIAELLLKQRRATSALDCFPWLHDHSVLDDVAGRGFLSLVQALHERGVKCSTDAMDKAAGNGHLDVVRFLHAHRSEGCTDKAMSQAATNGHLEVVEFLHAARTEGCTVDALDGAIRHGHLDVVRFLVEHRTEGASPDILDLAATFGHLDVVQYLHSRGSFGCTVNAVDKAVMGGHLGVIQFLLTNRREGCTRDVVVRCALEYGHLQVAEYLLSLGYPCPTSHPSMPRLLRLFIDNGGSLDGKWMQSACAENNLLLVRFLHEHSTACYSPQALEAAIQRSAWDVVHFLLANSTVSASNAVLLAAVRAGNLEVVLQILRRHPALRKNYKLLLEASRHHHTGTTRYLLAAGIGKPRDCLIKLAGRRQHVTASRLLLPYCMDATNHLGNMVFLLDLIALPGRRRARMLQLITPELTNQGRKTHETVPMAPSLAARTTTLQSAGEVVDWALALVIGHLWATDGTVTGERLTKWLGFVNDEELSAQISRLLSSKRKRSPSNSN
ncbi:hypothetical protein SPRG_16517 [Saprolegnia parasitica CBS 223.65]|uniref:Uncharacterized protein n=1 Tax=Saprolegnia parasitica (strain CBS 223.65) TaxID=695850 RepID=A0A067BI55_SAPPC|nr:hypothetical protein SPRG_16517 [Saprolegnia parasitica CBS 223.65]KDO18079.1 hypothetical protein SPRG_16517 [Saprolegnia parasitica CBS 223.65]|eukprot:XP_012211213.1 hypothetical protein SPRG_16517 [Saprolegnia parasitica CBS 223.65]